MDTPEVKRKIIGGYEHLEIEPGPPTPNVVVSPESKPGDQLRAIDMLESIQALFRSYGFALVHKPDSMWLARVSGPPGACRAHLVAKVRQVTPFLIEYQDNS